MARAAYCPTCGGALDGRLPCPLCAALATDGHELRLAETPLPDPAPAIFDDDAAAYERYLDSPRGQLRQELALGNLLAVLPELRTRRRTVLDLGGGSGRLAVRLARLGHDVTLVDPSREMVRLAEERAAASELAGRVRCVVGTADWLAGVGGRYELIAAHNVLEYLSEPQRLLEAAASALTPGGYLSLLCANRLAQPVMLASQGAPPSVIESALGRRRFPTNLFGRFRNEFAPDELVGPARRVGLEPVALRGVVVLSGLAPSIEPVPDEAAGWLRLELAMGREPAYLGLARYCQLIARRSV